MLNVVYMNAPCAVQAFGCANNITVFNTREVMGPLEGLRCTSFGEALLEQAWEQQGMLTTKSFPKDPTTEDSRKGTTCDDIECVACRYAGIANMKMRDWESTLTQAWKNKVGTFSVLDTITSLGGTCMACHSFSND